MLSERKSINTLSYLLLIIMAYYGPNAKLLGNVQLAIWQFQRPITDIQAHVIKLSILLAADLLSAVINGAMLWHFCKINILKVMKKLQQDFWYLFAVAEGFFLLEVKKLWSSIIFVHKL